MLRCVLGAGILAALTAAAAAQDEKKGQEVHGTVKNVDTEAGTLAVAVKGRPKADKNFIVTDATRVVVFQGDNRRQWTGPGGLKDEAVKEGARVTVVSDAEGKALVVRIGTPPPPRKGQESTGTLKRVDPSAGALTVAVKVNDEAVDREFTITDSTTVVLIDGQDRRELKGRDGLKDAAVKQGARVMIFSGPDGQVTRVRIGAPPKNDQE
jgi:hypothetical protein